MNHIIVVLWNLSSSICSAELNERLRKTRVTRFESWQKGPGPPLTYLNDGGVRQRFIFYTQKNPNFRICLPKKIPTFFSIPKKIPQCFCISKFYYLTSGTLKHINFNFGFGQKQNYKLRLCYFLFELMKNTIPKKISVVFGTQKNPFWPKCQTQNNPSDPPGH